MSHNVGLYGYKNILTVNYHQTPERMWSNRNAHSLRGMHTDAASLEDILVVSYKAKYTCPIQFSSYTRYLLKGVEKLCSHQILHTNVYSSYFFIISKLWNQPRCPSIAAKMDKQTSVHLDNGVLFSTKKKWGIKS